MEAALRKIALSKSLMLTVLLWVSISLPITYLKMYTYSSTYLLYIALISLAVLLLTVMPTSYFALVLKHRCPKCKALWSYAFSGDKVLERGNKSRNGVVEGFEKVLQKHSCGNCGYEKLTPRIRSIKETI